jgi:4-alpha-glucanotransferase
MPERRALSRTTRRPKTASELEALARELGILSDYVDASGTVRQAAPEALRAMVGALTGCEPSDERAAGELRRERARAQIAAGAQRVIVAWDGVLDEVAVWKEKGKSGRSWAAEVRCEDGTSMTARGELAAAVECATSPLGAVQRALPLQMRLPLGYHQLALSWQGRRAEALVIAAPRRAPRGPQRGLGVFAPVYALRGPSQAGSGTLAELDLLMHEVRALGGDFVATLPLLAQFLERPYDPSPFAPASRLFWNELYLDLDRLRGMPECEEASALRASAAFRASLAKLEAQDFVAAGRKVALVHALLEPLARRFFAHGGEQHPGFRAYLTEQPYAREYALYRTALEVHGDPEKLRGRVLSDDDARPGRKEMHLYAQWQMHEQLSALTTRARDAGTLLYLDMPVGVHTASFDVWREPACFVPGVCVGAPPDALCPEGQNWGFAPGHPEGQRAQAFRYFIASTRNQLRHAGILRIDHVAGLSRLFCIPHGLRAEQGVYLEQPAEEMHAVLTLEARRSGSVLVGEDLGIVPAVVRKAMREHGLKRTFVLPFEVERKAQKSRVRRVPADALAAVNTHDMPSFAGFWEGRDIDARRARGVLSPESEREEREARKVELSALRASLGLSNRASRESTLLAALRFLGESPAHLVMVTLEDLWGELEPQNVPGTSDPDRNFARRMRHRVDVLATLPEVRRFLRALARARREASGRGRQISIS